MIWICNPYIDQALVLLMAHLPREDVREAFDSSFLVWFLAKGCLLHRWLTSSEAELSPHVNLALKKPRAAWVAGSAFWYPPFSILWLLRRHMPRRRANVPDCTPSPSAPCPGRPSLHPTHPVSPSLNSITQEGTLKNPHL